MKDVSAIFAPSVRIRPRLRIPLRLADRLNAARRAQIVGRERETALFIEALHAEELPFLLLHV